MKMSGSLLTTSRLLDSGWSNAPRQMGLVEFVVWCCLPAATASLGAAHHLSIADLRELGEKLGQEYIRLRETAPPPAGTCPPRSANVTV